MTGGPFQPHGEGEAAVSEAVASRVQRRKAAPHRLLLVDDETPILFAMAAYFRSNGYLVDAAREREEAEALLANVTYAAVIVDLRMTAVHGADGLEIVVYARERCPSARIIVLTAYGSPAAEAEARARGADAFLHKPQPLGDLVQLLESLLGRNGP